MSFIIQNGDIIKSNNANLVEKLTKERFLIKIVRNLLNFMIKILLWPINLFRRSNKEKLIEQSSSYNQDISQIINNSNINNSKEAESSLEEKIMATLLVDLVDGDQLG